MCVCERELCRTCARKREIESGKASARAREYVCLYKKTWKGERCTLDTHISNEFLGPLLEIQGSFSEFWDSLIEMHGSFAKIPGSVAENHLQDRDNFSVTACGKLQNSK